MGYTPELGCTVQNWAVGIEVCSVESGCSVQSQSAGHSRGSPWKLPLALGQEHSCRDKQDTGSRATVGDNGQERKCVQTLSWMWSPSGASSSTISRKTKGEEAKHLIFCIWWCSGTWAEGFGVPAHTHETEAKRSRAPSLLQWVGEGGLSAHAWLPTVAPGPPRAAAQATPGCMGRAPGQAAWPGRALLEVLTFGHIPLSPFAW